jgi:hypothetical protein
MAGAKSQKLHALYDVVEFRILFSATFLSRDSTRTAAQLALRLIDEITTATQHIKRSVDRQQRPSSTRLTLVAKAVPVLVILLTINR